MPIIIPTLCTTMAIASGGFAAVEDADRDALDLIADRPEELPTFATVPLESDAPWWIRTHADGRLGLLGEHRPADSTDGPRPSSTTLGLVSEQASRGVLPDRFSVGTTLVDADPLSSRSPSRAGVFAAWGWELRPGLLVQPGLGWSVDAAGDAERTTLTLGVRLEF